MAKQRQEMDGGGNWMDTYGDMVTLLMTFFIAMYSMSSIQEDKWADLVKAFNINGTEKVDQIVFTVVDDGEDLVNNSGDSNGYNPGDNDDDSDEVDFSDLYNYLKTHIETNEMSDSIYIEKGSLSSGTGDGVADETKKGYENIYIQFSNNVLFNPDDSTMLATSYPIMEFMGQTLKQFEGGISKIVIKGYTANAPYSSADERTLSSMRATVISNYFEKTCNIESTQLIAIGLGNDYPVATNDTENGRMQNRRVEIVIIPSEGANSKTEDWELIFGSFYSNENSGEIAVVVGE